MIDSQRDEYFELRVKRQTHIGIPAVAVYVRNRTKKVREKLHSLLRREEIHSRQQAENFSSVISHEMRTPLLNIIFFLKRVLGMLGKERFNKNMIIQCTQYCQMSLGQLEFLGGFIDDLLDLGMIKSGTFSLKEEQFDILSVVKLILKIFSPQAKAKNVKMRATVQQVEVYDSELFSD